MIAIRAELGRRARRSRNLAAVITIAVLVVWTHGAIGERHMGMEGDAEAVMICLAIAQTFGLVGALRYRPALLARLRAPVVLPALGAGAIRPSRPTGPALSRDGPIELGVLLR